MKFLQLILISLFLLILTSCDTEMLQNISKDFNLPIQQQAPLSDTTIISGLKEALSIGTRKAVGSVSVPDGYFGNQIIKIVMPDKMRKAADILGKAGFQRQVNEFVLSMNRAAEKAAPQAAGYFVDAIKEMTFDDARRILHGGNTAATEYFRQKTETKIATAFKPIVAASMNEVGATRAYKKVTGNLLVLPIASGDALDLDGYVTGKAVNGLFYMLGEEEKKIRTDPAARVTELLRTVFGGRMVAGR